ncbi:MAG: toll/interleukin-1 receptor domain-containing protein, partial [Bacteroidota bacterium]
MANQEHLEILKSGVKHWNQWRRKNTGQFVDLRYANLRQADLREANLSSAYLRHADLSKADLKKADLSKADLTNADLSEADLWNANLTNANLTNANLRKANLSETKLRDANLTNAESSSTIFHFTKFNGVDFLDTRIGSTIFANCNLNEAINLGAVTHYSPSSIDFQTLKNSPNIPLIFLKRMGLPENYINYLPDFYDETPIRLYPVFLSHSNQDKAFAKKAYDALTNKGAIVWYDEKELKPGDKIRSAITQRIDTFDFCFHPPAVQRGFRADEDHFIE